ncbi:MAG: hemerythrin family protein [Deltaproteobacteria bacterium]|nr:hemerythrin family protein [Deltaproteobacteria bacterium]
MSFKWSDNMAIGNEVIDDQHKELFGKLGDLSEAISEGNDVELIEEVFRYLETYVTQHFSDEEKLMEECEYPEIETQKKEHAGFIEEFKAFEAEFSSKGPSSELAEKTHSWLLNWLCDHIARTDKALGLFLEKN